MFGSGHILLLVKDILLLGLGNWLLIYIYIYYTPTHNFILRTTPLGTETIGIT
jgi:hypothetical protein